MLGGVPKASVWPPDSVMLFGSASTAARLARQIMEAGDECRPRDSEARHGEADRVV